MSWLRHITPFGWFLLIATIAGLAWLVRRWRQTLPPPRPAQLPPIIVPDTTTLDPTPANHTTERSTNTPTDHAMAPSVAAFAEMLPALPLPQIRAADLLQAGPRQLIHRIAGAAAHNEYQQVIQQLDLLDEHTKDNPEWLLTRASTHIEMHDFAQAAQCLYQLQTTHPNSHHAKDAVMLEMATEIEFGDAFAAAMRQLRIPKVAPKPKARPKPAPLLTPEQPEQPPPNTTHAPLTPAPPTLTPPIPTSQPTPEPTQERPAPAPVTLQVMTPAAQTQTPTALATPQPTLAPNTPQTVVETKESKKDQTPLPEPQPVSLAKPPKEPTAPKPAPQQPKETKASIFSQEDSSRMEEILHQLTIPKPSPPAQMATEPLAIERLFDLPKPQPNEQSSPGSEPLALDLPGSEPLALDHLFDLPFSNEPPKPPQSRAEVSDLAPSDAQLPSPSLDEIMATFDFSMPSEAHDAPLSFSLQEYPNDTNPDDEDPLTWLDDFEMDELDDLMETAFSSTEGDNTVTESENQVTERTSGIADTDTTDRADDAIVFAQESLSEPKLPFLEQQERAALAADETIAPQETREPEVEVAAQITANHERPLTEDTAEPEELLSLGVEEADAGAFVEAKAPGPQRVGLETLEQKDAQIQVLDLPKTVPMLGGIVITLAIHLEHRLEEIDRLRGAGERDEAHRKLEELIALAPHTRYAKDAQMRLLGDLLFREDTWRAPQDEDEDEDGDEDDSDEQVEVLG